MRTIKITSKRSKNINFINKLEEELKSWGGLRVQKSIGDQGIYGSLEVFGTINQGSDGSAFFKSNERLGRFVFNPTGLDIFITYKNYLLANIPVECPPETFLPYAQEIGKKYEKETKKKAVLYYKIIQRQFSKHSRQ